jgi:hypothetical protein
MNLRRYAKKLMTNTVKPCWRNFIKKIIIKLLEMLF